MKRKEFQKPEAMVTRFNAVDIVTASKEPDPPTPGRVGMVYAPTVQVGSSGLMK